MALHKDDARIARRLSVVGVLALFVLDTAAVAAAWIVVWPYAT
jgi:hypothetical protein